MSQPDDVAEAGRLYERWRRTLADAGSSVAADAAEQLAYDDLIEHLEATGLNFSALDPRGDT